MPQRNSVTDLSMKGYPTSKPRFRDLAWKLIFTTTACCFVSHFILLTIRFSSQPVISYSRRHAVNFDFPDITLCNAAPYSWARTTDAPVTLKSNITVTANYLVYGIKNFWKTILPQYSNLPLNRYTRDDNYVSRNTIYQYGLHFGFGRESHELFLDCVYRKEPCNFENFTKIIMPSYLYCFTFSPKNRLPKQGGENDGLELLILDADRRFLLTEKEAIDFIRGLIVLIHQPGSAPDFNVWTQAQVGYHTKVSLHVIKDRCIDRSEKPCVSSRPSEELCIKSYTGSIVMNRSVEYSQSSCVHSRVQENFIASCQCYSELYYIPRHLTHLQLPYCHYLPEGVIREYEKVENRTLMRLGNVSIYLDEAVNTAELGEIKARHECHDSMMKSIDYNKFLPHCPSLCDTTIYQIHSTNHVWPESAQFAETHLKRLGQDLRARTIALGLDDTLIKRAVINNTELDSTSFLRRRVARLTIYPQHYKADLQEEQPAYPTSGFLSDFGGILGLWAGISVIKIIEAIEGCFAAIVKINA